MCRDEGQSPENSSTAGCHRSCPSQHPFPCSLLPVLTRPPERANQYQLPGENVSATHKPHTGHATLLPRVAERKRLGLREVRWWQLAHPCLVGTSPSPRGHGVISRPHIPGRGHRATRPASPHAHWSQLHKCPARGRCRNALPGRGGTRLPRGNPNVMFGVTVTVIKCTSPSRDRVLGDGRSPLGKSTLKS